MADTRIFSFNLQVRIELKIFWSQQHVVLRDCKWVTVLSVFQLLASTETSEIFYFLFFWILTRIGEGDLFLVIRDYDLIYYKINL
jgi:hypothetical protein